MFIDCLSQKRTVDVPGGCSFGKQEIVKPVQQLRSLEAVGFRHPIFTKRFSRTLEFSCIEDLGFNFQPPQGLFNKGYLRRKAGPFDTAFGIAIDSVGYIANIICLLGNLVPIGNYEFAGFPEIRQRIPDLITVSKSNGCTVAFDIYPSDRSIRFCRLNHPYNIVDTGHIVLFRHTKS